MPGKEGTPLPDFGPSNNFTYIPRSIVAARLDARGFKPADSFVDALYVDRSAADGGNVTSGDNLVSTSTISGLVVPDVLLRRMLQTRQREQEKAVPLFPLID